MALRAQESAKQRKAAEALKAQQAAAQPPSATQTATMTAGEHEERRARMIARKEEQMDKLDDDIDECTDPKLIHFLTGSRERVFNEWCVLTGTAKPAPRKTTSAPQRQRAPMSDPT